MGVVDRTMRTMGRTVSRAATATTSAAGAVGGAAVNGVVGGVRGAAEGIQQGLSTGSKSTPAAALAIGAIGAAGLVEWPILLAVGGGALLLRKMSHSPEPPVQAVQPAKAKLAPVPDEPPAKKAPAKTAA
ncbi:MAG: hypothetical protein K2X97_20870 [Mycobacteriaceae bacterium]|nr:hypothetical protein [Mycobacteriaceae bacterium]